MESRRSEFQDFPVTSLERTQSYASGCKGKKSKLCPKYHDEGLCELGPNCNLIHEEKRNYFSTLDPTIPEFLPRTAQKSFMPSENFNHWDDTLSRDETDLALPTCLSKSRILIGSCNFGSDCYFVYGDVLTERNVLFITTKKKRIFLSTRIVSVKISLQMETAIWDLNVYLHIEQIN
ncbi:unnamed protein product [Clavelina lepadiformis]|uniref:C3H1-type domain-containing protein n=1 Tax=Clavelina lepadiformis TaxID=159417 RepID=A0ABP0G1D0_CLALP